MTIIDDEIRKRAVRQAEAARLLKEEIGIRGKAGRIARDRQNTQLGLRQRKPEHTNNKQTPQRQ